MNSFWINEESVNFSELKEKEKIDVCVVGGGITGVSIAYKLSKSGKSVAILEKDLISSHTTGGSTGKITSQHGLLYKYLFDLNGESYAKKYFMSNQNAVRDIEKIIKDENIDCDLENKNAYVFTQSAFEIDNINKEVEYAKKIGIKAEYVKKIDLSMDILGAIKFENQAQFNPVKYVNGLVKAILKENSKIFENSKVIDIEEKSDFYIVRTEKGEIEAKDVVLATRYPIINFPGYYFLKMYQSTSYCAVFDTNTNLNFDGFYINCENPTISFRTVKDSDGKNLLQIVGYDYKTGDEIIGNPFEYLESKVKRIYPQAKRLISWTAEDCISLDKIPYIGNFSKNMEHIYVATGFNKWGISTSNVAANIITDKILGRKNEYEDIFKSNRLNPIKNKDEMINMLKESANGIILRKIKDAPNPTCTHLGCTLSWNPLEETWDCACHGSRFTEGRRSY